MSRTPSIPDLLETLEYGPAPESAERALAWIEAHGGRFGHFIGGEWSVPGPERFVTHNPATGQGLAEVTQGSEEDVARAVAAAAAAFPAWRDAPASTRSRLLYGLGRLVQRHARLFAVLETLDSGKPIREARDIDVPLVARHFHHHAGWAGILAEALPGHEPLGVVGQIIPWNFPLLMLSWKVAPALAAGNTVVLKPAEFSPLTALLFADLCQQAGLPPGVVNIVTGDGLTGEALVQHPDVAKIAFTGSTEVGRIIRRATAGSGKRLSLELGGKSPFIVFDDADLDSVVEGVVDAIWFNQGEVCCAGSRILVHEGTAPALERKLRARMERLRVGDPMDKTTDMGAVIDAVQLERIAGLVERGRAEGAQVWQPEWSPPETGWFYPPTLCTGVEPAGTLAQVEIFGPVVVLMTFRTPSEAVELANDTRYGLAASIWTENVNVALDLAPRIRAGTVWVNCTNLFDAAAGFGGYRESGYGREGGIEGMREYLQPAWLAEDRVRPAPAAPQLTVGEGLFPAPGGGVRPPLSDFAAPAVDRTHKLYIGGKQQRPDEGYSLRVTMPDGTLLGEVPRGNRKDVRNAVEAARGAQPGWGSATAHLRSQILCYLGENLAAREDALASALARLAGMAPEAALAEVRASVDRCFLFGGWADKWDGRVHATPFRNVTLAMPEPLGVIGIRAPEPFPLLGLIGTLAPALAMGNTVVLVPSASGALVASELYALLDTSDIPAGAVNLVTGLPTELLRVLSEHDDVDAVWDFGDAVSAEVVERLSVGNMKQTRVDRGRQRPWLSLRPGEAESFLEWATQIKNVWVPYGA